MSEKKLYLLDGHALVYRAHYAFINRPLINSKGINTSAITGFVRSLQDILINQKPTHIAVAFDPKGPTFRHKEYTPYKANRDAQPEDIGIALPYINKIVDGFNIPVIMEDGYEADDAIGTVAKQAEKEGFKVYMVTPDKDYAQLVSENIFMYKPARFGNGIEILGEPEVLAKWDIARVEQVIDVLGLQGDSVDNIPGIPGIGAKTAVKLLKEFDSVEGIIENADKLKGKQKEKVIEFADQGRMSKWLATIKLDVPVTFDAERYKLEPINKEALSEIFAELEFRTLAKQILGGPKDSSQSKTKEKGSSSTQGNLFGGGGNIAPVPEYSVVKNNIENTKHDYKLIDTEEGYKKLASLLAKQKTFSFDTETTGIDANEAELVGISFSFKKATGYYVPIPADKKEAIAILDHFKGVLEDPKIEKIGQNIKYDILMMKWYNVFLQGSYFDTMIAHYLSEPDLRHKLDYLTEAYLDYKMVPIEDLIGKRGKNQKTMRDVPITDASEYASEDADLTLQVKEVLHKKLKEDELEKLYYKIEEPLINVLAKLEFEGVKVDGEFLNKYSYVLKDKLVEVEDKIFDQAGVDFNIASPKQVGQVLFEKLKIPYRWRKTSSGQFSTDVEKLKELSADHDIIKDILQFRKYAKLKSTYVDALPQMINSKTGRVHTNYNQSRAATGRLSSENPNLQNIPIKDEAGREIRKAFVPRDKDHILLAADYSQIELRLIAEISKDETMLEAFSTGNDFHKATAAKVYEVPFEEVTAEQRRNAKTVNFSIIYGAGSTNLSRQLGIKRGEAKDLIENYFKQFQGLKKYMDETVNFARENGYVITLLGRKRILRDINSRNGLARTNAERMAINTPIQGTAADMIKLAMIDIDKAMSKLDLKSKMILQVHDELVFDVYKPELEDLKKLIDDKMKNAIPELNVPIIVEMGTGDNWLEAH